MSLQRIAQMVIDFHQISNADFEKKYPEYSRSHLHNDNHQALVDTLYPMAKKSLAEKAQSLTDAAGYGGTSTNEFETEAEAAACNRIVELEDQNADLIQIVKALTVK